MSRVPLLRLTNAGLYCEHGGFHIDPWSPCAYAVITHAHADHAVKGSRRYLTAESGRLILQHRMGSHAAIETLPFGTPLVVNGVKVSLHPAGHILGSCQVRVEYRDEVWVVSGDYKVAPDATCAPFEPVKCHTFITESTFAHPFFHWESQSETFAEIHKWRKKNRYCGKACVVYAYSLGKAQRLVAGLDHELAPVFAHPWIESMNEIYRESGSSLPLTRPLTDLTIDNWPGAVILLPPAARWHAAIPNLGHYATAFASGWMTLPNGPADRRVESGFALSDHADHDELLKAIADTGAERILVTHGYITELVAELKSLGYDAEPHPTIRCKRPPRVPSTPAAPPSELSSKLE